MTKLITALILIIAVYCGYHLFLYWEQIQNEDQNRQKAAAQFNPDTLPGMTPQLEKSYQAAQQQGTAAIRNWLKTYGNLAQDPRKAWIELDYCVAIARDNPAEARRVFDSVKARTASTSPVWPRAKQLEKTFE